MWVSVGSFRRSRRGTASSIKSDSGDSSEAALTKLDVVLSFNVEVIVQEVQGLKSLQPTKLLYCTMEVEGGGEKLQTDRVEVSKAHWDTQVSQTDHIFIILYCRNSP